MIHIVPEEPDFLNAHSARATAMCPNPAGRFSAAAQVGPEGEPKVWLFIHPTVHAGKGGRPKICDNMEVFHGTYDDWCYLNSHWSRLRVTFREDPSLHIPFSGGTRAKSPMIERALLRKDAPSLVIATWEQIVLPPVIVEYKSGNNTVGREFHEHGFAWIAARVARTQGIYHSPMRETTHEVRQVREPIAGDWTVVIRVRNKPMKRTT